MTVRTRASRESSSFHRFLLRSKWMKSLNSPNRKKAISSAVTSCKTWYTHRKIMKLTQWPTIGIRLEFRILQRSDKSNRQDRAQEVFFEARLKKSQLPHNTVKFSSKSKHTCQTIQLGRQKQFMSSLLRPKLKQNSRK